LLKELIFHSTKIYQKDFEVDFFLQILFKIKRTQAKQIDDGGATIKIRTDNPILTYEKSKTI